MQEYTVTGKDAGKRLDRFLAERRPELSRIFILKGLRTNKVKRNGRRAEGSDRLAAGDVIADYMLAAPKKDAPLRTDGFTVVYEDVHLLIANKRAGLLSEDLTGKVKDTLEAEVNAYLAPKGERARLCHRIDYNTEGLVILAKDKESLAILERAIRERTIEKRYLCVAAGRLTPPAGRLICQLFKDAKKNRVYLTDEPVKGSKTAITDYRTIDTRGGLSLVECRLLTGRTHQIRSQLARAGAPLLGDDKYGVKEENKKYGERRQLLAAYKLTLRFAGPAGPLAPLEGRTFTAGRIAFKEKYFGK